MRSKGQFEISCERTVCISPQNVSVFFKAQRKIWGENLVSRGSKVVVDHHDATLPAPSCGSQTELLSIKNMLINPYSQTLN